MCVCETLSPGLTPDLPEVADAHSGAHTSVEVPADLEVGMVGVEPDEIKGKEKAGVEQRPFLRPEKLSAGL